MFRLKKEGIDDQEILTIIHPNGKSTFSTLSSLGAALFKLQLTDQQKTKNIFKYWDNPSSLLQDYLQRFSGAQLFPFPNRLANGSYQLHGMAYQFPRNDFGRPNALHGHLYNRSFEQDSWDAEKGLLSLVHNNDAADPAFPFSYSIKNQFILKKNELIIATGITNYSDQSIPIGYGWHPYFKTTGSVDNYYLEIPSTNLMEVNTELIPTQKMVPFDTFRTPSKILNRELDNCLELEKNSKYVSLTDPEKKTRISLDISQFDYLQVYIPPERDAIALEPQSCAPDAFNNGSGLVLLDAGKSKTYTFKISLEALPYKE